MKFGIYQKGILYLLLTLLPLTVQSSEEKEIRAHKAATAWLQLVDQQQYRDSWEQAATLFRKQVDASTWTQQMTAVRQPMGDAGSRILLGATYTTSLPGAPDGEYVVIQFRTVFTHKKDSIETLTAMLDNGHWRVAGYYVR
jgi:hypothetical protein